MIMKKSFPLLRVIGLSACLVASAAMMPSVHAATSGTITATGTVPATCSVSGADIAMTYTQVIQTLEGYSAYIPVTTNGSNTIFTLTKPSATFPNGTPNNVNGSIDINYRNGTPSSLGTWLDTRGGAISTNSSTPSVSETFTGNFTGVVRFGGFVSAANSAALPAGSYTLNSTFTCVAN